VWQAIVPAGAFQAAPAGLAVSRGSQSWLQPAFSRLPRCLPNFTRSAVGPWKHTRPKKHHRLALLAELCSKSRLKGGCTVESLVLAGPQVGPDGNQAAD